MNKNILDKDKTKTRQIVGWREWVSLPDLKIQHIKAKLDTGAKTSALHAYFIEPFIADKKQRVRFGVYTLQNKNKLNIICNADVIDQRKIVDSGGHSELRFIIMTSLIIGENTTPIELSLANRKNNRFRLLLGRTAIEKLIAVDPARSYTLGKPLKK
ncbi:ATP-dependent zinc protease [Thermodesulfobacteriota bacterium]